MKAFILSDQPEIAKRIRALLLREGEECPLESVVTFESPLPTLEDNAVVVFVVLSRGSDRGLGMVGRLHRQGVSRVVAVGPANDSQLLLQAIHAGACDFIDENNLDADCQAALSRLHGESEFEREGQVIAILSPSGGTGASTAAVNLAVALAQQKQRPLLIDMNMPLGDLASLLDLNPSHTMADLCQHADRMDRIMLERTVASHESGVKLLAGPSKFGECSSVTADGVVGILGLARRAYTHIVIDLDNSFRQEQVAALQNSDLVLLMVQLSFASIRSGRQTLRILEELQIHPTNLRLVIGRYGEAREVPPAKAEQVLGMKIDHYIPEDQGTVNQANNDGVPLVTASPRSRVARSIAELATGVCGIIAHA